MIYLKLPPVLDSKNVLLDHIKAKLKQFVLTSIVNDLAVELCENKSSADLFKLLQHENLLKEALLNIKTDGNTKQKLGTELFAKVSQFDTSLCAQITGMLLELDVITICVLLSDLDALEIAITKAKKEYTKYKQKSSKEFYGEEIYSQVLDQFPDSNLAGRLTGMLLELDVSVLQHLLEDSEEFRRRLEVAYSVISRYTIMASEKHQELASFLKGVHQNLRLQSRAKGADQAWHHHCQQTQLLQKYAENMQRLATEFWEVNSGNDSDLCRIQWVVKKCDDYFNNGGYKQAIEKEEKLSQRYFNKSVSQCEKSAPLLKLLDVGSCYNPFSKFSIFEVTAVDLVPAVENVLKCDFLSVIISNGIESINNPCTELPERYFDVVVFSLLLEYLPSPKQRLKCCNNAYRVLKDSGLLFILTPDSKHATANSKMMKSWRFALASMGFWRIGYQKLKHIHCMYYRKCTDPQLSKYWLSTQQCQKSVEDLMYIPQDFHEYSDNLVSHEPLKERCDSANKFIADSFSDLPECDIFS